MGAGDEAIVVTRLVVVVEAAGTLAGAAVALWGLVVVVGRVVDVVVGAVVVVGADVVVTSAAVVDVTSVPLAPALSERRMAGSLSRWGNPAMATPTAAHTTSMSTVIVRCPGLTPLTVGGVLSPRGDRVGRRAGTQSADV